MFKMNGVVCEVVILNFLDAELKLNNKKKKSYYWIVKTVIINEVTSNHTYS